MADPGVHLNGNILAVVDVETTGTKPRFHDIIEICVLPLDNALNIRNDIIPFHVDMKPKNPENIDFEAVALQKKHNNPETQQFDNVCLNKERIVDVTLRGLDPYTAADRFHDWFQRLKLPGNKKIMPIAHNWVFDREFIIDWLGETDFYAKFDPRYRDTMVMSLYENDKTDYHWGYNHPFAKNNLQYLCTTLGIERIRAHTALDDCVVTAKVFKRIVQQSVYVSHPSDKIQGGQTS